MTSGARLSRRALLAGAFTLSPLARALGQVPASGQVDVVIVGAGAAGIAAARKVAAAGRSYALIEASKRVGGRPSPTPPPSASPGIWGPTGSICLAPRRWWIWAGRRD